MTRLRLTDTHKNFVALFNWPTVIKLRQTANSIPDLAGPVESETQPVEQYAAEGQAIGNWAISLRAVAVGVTGEVDPLFRGVTGKVAQGSCGVHWGVPSPSEGCRRVYMASERGFWGEVELGGASVVHGASLGPCGVLAGSSGG